MKILRDRKLIIDLPERLDFEANYEITASHFRCLRSAINSGVRLRSLRFNKLQFISPAAALVLASEVDRWQMHRRGKKLRAEVESWHKDIARLLGEMGYFELLELPKPVAEPPGNTVFLPFRRGDVGDRDAGKIARQLRIAIETLVGTVIKRHLLFEGISEAITNVCQHAYANQPFGGRFWWLSASYDRPNARLSVIFYDQGVGIPVTLPSSDFFERIRDWSNLWSDSQKIEAAMEVGRTSTDLTERGKGLQNLLEFAKSYPEGRLAIYSLHGLYQMNSTHDSTGVRESIFRQDFDNSVGGTLIEWTVKLA